MRAHTHDHSEFQSWRTFTYLGEYPDYQIKSAPDRFERRRMQQANETVSRKHKQKDNERLITMVSLAYDNDPRIQRRRIMAEVERARAKQAEDDRRKAEEAAAKEAAERQARETAEREANDKAAAKETKAREAKRRKDLRRNLRKVADAHELSAVDVEFACENGDMSRIESFLAAAESAGNVPALFAELMATLRS